MEPKARWSRLPQGLRGLQVGHGAQGSANRHSGEDHQGLRSWQELRGSQRYPPDEEADAREPKGLPRRNARSNLGCCARRKPVPTSVLPPWPRCARDSVHARAPPRTRRIPARAPFEVCRLHPARSKGLRCREGWFRHPRGCYHHGVRSTA